MSDPQPVAVVPRFTAEELGRVSRGEQIRGEWANAGQFLIPAQPEDLAAYALALRGVVEELMDMSIRNKTDDSFYGGRDYYGEPGGKYCIVCNSKSGWDSVARDDAAHDEDCPVRRARALLGEDA